MTELPIYSPTRTATWGLSKDFYTAVGFLAGEGHIRFDTSIGHGHNRIAIDAGQIEDKPLLILASLFGGKVYGPYKRTGKNPDNYIRQPIFRWVAQGSRAAGIIMTILPVLKQWHIGKYIQAVQALTEWKKTTPPSKYWTHCKRGHERTKENTQIDSDGGRRCKACKRKDYING